MQLFRLFTGTEEQGQALHGHDEEDGTADEGDGVLLGLLVAVLPLVEHADGIGGGQHGGNDVDEGLDIGPHRPLWRNNHRTLIINKLGVTSLNTGGCTQFL